MNLKETLDQDLMALIETFESKKHDLQNRPAQSQPNLLFADVAILNKSEPNPYEGAFISRRVVRTDIPQVFTWLFKQFTPILSKLPHYGALKEEIFGRLGNTISMAENPDLQLSADEKVAAVFQEFYEIAQDMIEGKMAAFAVASGAEIYDDYVTRAIKSGYVSHEEFLESVFGEGK